MKTLGYAIAVLIVFVAGVQLGIRHGRTLEASDHRRYVQGVFSDGQKQDMAYEQGFQACQEQF